MDQKALSSLLKRKRGNRNNFSRLTSWLDRLLPFECEVIHAPESIPGFADYLSPHPSPICGKSVKAEELWKNWLTVNHESEFNSTLANQFQDSIRCKQRDCACDE